MMEGVTTMSKKNEMEKTQIRQEMRKMMEEVLVADEDDRGV